MKQIFYWMAVAVALGSSPAFSDEGKKRTLTEVSGAQVEAVFAAGREVRVEAHIPDDLVAAGGIVSVVNTLVEDLILAGGRIFIAASGVQDLMLAGGTLELSGVSGDDVFAAGGSLDFAADIRDDFIVAGGRVHTSAAHRVGGVARIAGGDVGIEGTFAKDVYLVGGAVRLDADVAGNLEIWGGTIALGPATRIGGILRYAADEPPQMAAGAVVAGGIERLPVTRRRIDGDIDEILGGIVFVFVVLLVGIVVVVVVVQSAVPGLISDGVTRLVGRPWENLGIGAAVAVITPPALVLLAVTLVGLPLAILAGLAYLLVGAGALTVLAYRIGLWLRERATDAVAEPDTWTGRAVWTLAGVLILAALLMVPFIGWAVLVLAMAAAMGALLAQARTALA